MISSVIDSIVDRLEMYFDSVFGGSAPKVIASSLMNQNNEFIPETVEKQVIVTLVNIEEQSYSTARDYTNKPTHIVLTILISILAEDDYDESLQFLSAVIQFFQANSTLTQDNTPQLHEDIEKLDFGILNSDLRDIGGLWGALGAKYMPSVVYKVKYVTFTSDGFGIAARI